MRAIESWVIEPLGTFLTESSARLTLLMTTSGQVIAQHGFTRALDVMAAAALGAAIMASTSELARTMGWTPFSVVAHQGTEQGHFLAQFETPRGRWIGLVVFGKETSLGLVQLFFERMVQELIAAAPQAGPAEPVLGHNFEHELNASLRSLFGR